MIHKMKLKESPFERIKNGTKTIEFRLYDDKDEKKMEAKVFYDLKEKAKLVNWKNERRKEMFILFSASGYSEELKKIANDTNQLILF